MIGVTQDDAEGTPSEPEAVELTPDSQIPEAVERSSLPRRRLALGGGEASEEEEGLISSDEEWWGSDDGYVQGPGPSLQDSPVVNESDKEEGVGGLSQLEGARSNVGIHSPNAAAA